MLENFVKTTVSTAAVAADTTLVVNAVAAPFNSPPDPAGGTGTLTLVDNINNPGFVEIITYTGRTGTGPYTLTGVSRAQEGTTARDWPVGTLVIMTTTAATLDYTGAEIKALYEGEADTNAFTDADVTKLAGVEAGATGDLTGAEIKALYEGEADTNAFTDADVTALAGAAQSGGSETFTDIQLTGGGGDLGTLSWNDTDKTLDLRISTDVTLQLGQEQLLRVRNTSGGTINNGQVVYLSGSNGVNMTMGLADATNQNTSESTLGLVTETSIANNSEGMITTHGLVRDLNTSAFTDGAPLYLDTSAGGITATVPASPAHNIRIGWCVRSHATLGVIYVNTDHAGHLEFLDDVLITTPANDEVLTYETATGLWKNKAPSGGGGGGNFSMATPLEAATILDSAGTTGDIKLVRNQGVHIEKRAMTGLEAGLTDNASHGAIATNLSIFNDSTARGGGPVDEYIAGVARIGTTDKFVMMADDRGQIGIFSRNPTTQALTQIAESPTTGWIPETGSLTIPMGAAFNNTDPITFTGGSGNRWPNFRFMASTSEAGVDPTVFINPATVTTVEQYLDTIQTALGVTPRSWTADGSGNVTMPIDIKQSDIGGLASRCITEADFPHTFVPPIASFKDSGTEGAWPDPSVYFANDATTYDLVITVDATQYTITCVGSNLQTRAAIVSEINTKKATASPSACPIDCVGTLGDAEGVFIYPDNTVTKNATFSFGVSSLVVAGTAIQIQLSQAHDGSLFSDVTSHTIGAVTVAAHTPHNFSRMEPTQNNLVAYDATKFLCIASRAGGGVVITAFDTVGDTITLLDQKKCFNSGNFANYDRDFISITKNESNGDQWLATACKSWANENKAMFYRWFTFNGTTITLGTEYFGKGTWAEADTDTNGQGIHHECSNGSASETFFYGNNVINEGGTFRMFVEQTAGTQQMNAIGVVSFGYNQNPLTQVPGNASINLQQITGATQYTSHFVPSMNARDSNVIHIPAASSGVLENGSNFGITLMSINTDTNRDKVSRFLVWGGLERSDWEYEIIPPNKFGEMNIRDHYTYVYDSTTRQMILITEMGLRYDNTTTTEVGGMVVQFPVDMVHASTRRIPVTRVALIKDNLNAAITFPQDMNPSNHIGDNVLLFAGDDQRSHVVLDFSKTTSGDGWCYDGYVPTDANNGVGILEGVGPIDLPI